LPTPRPPFDVRSGNAHPRSSRGSHSKAPRALQLQLPLSSGWGGRRAGAGRPAGPGRPSVPHRSRPTHRAEHPVHVTLRSLCRSLRTQFVFPTVRRAIAVANRSPRSRIRIVHFSVQTDHLHLLVEADNRGALVEGLRGLCIRIARAVNQLLNRRGRFFADRWHGRALTSPRQVRNALVYVLANFRKHHPTARPGIDPYSSAPYCHDFIEFPHGPPAARFPHPLTPLDDPASVVAQSWLLSKGWKRNGKLSLSERPAH
jgi:REP element-mobilizing transposase RayT